MINELREKIKEEADSEKAKNLQRFFKTGDGEYGEGDVFLGITVPKQRKIIKEFKDKITLKDAEELLRSKIHEERLIALLLLIEKYKKANLEGKKDIFDFYLKNTARINNWDLVDLSAPNIVGDFLLDKKQEREILYKLAKSDSLWEKRISIISCFGFIRQGDFKDALAISEILLKDKHDLIHKAVGWALREIGKKDQQIEEKFLQKHYKNMPRTMLRYSIEKFPESLRKRYLNGEI